MELLIAMLLLMWIGSPLLLWLVYKALGRLLGE